MKQLIPAIAILAFSLPVTVLGQINKFNKKATVTGAVLFSPYEYKLNESNLNQTDKHNLSQATLYKQGSNSGAVIYRVGVEAPLTKTVAFVGYLYASRSHNNEFLGSTSYAPGSHPDNSYETISIVTPGKGIEADFYYTQFLKQQTQGRASYNSQEIQIGLKKSFKNGGIQLSGGVNRNAQELDYITTTSGQVTHYTSKTELRKGKDGVDYWNVSNIVLDQKPIVGEKSVSKKDTFIRPVVSLQGTTDVYRSRNGKLKLGLEAGVRYVIGDGVKPNVGFRAALKM